LNTELHEPTLNGISVASTSEVYTSDMLNC